MIIWLHLPLMLWGILTAFPLALSGGRPPSPLLVWIGILLIAGGIWFDALITIHFTPDFSLEANPFMITLRDSYYPDWWLRVLWLGAQVPDTLLNCAIWTAFLRHAPTYLKTVWAMDPHSLPQFMAASLGLNLNRPFLRQRPDLFPRAYRFLWIYALTFIAPFDRYIGALSWLKLTIPGWVGNAYFLPVKAAAVLLFLFWLIVSYFTRQD